MCLLLRARVCVDKEAQRDFVTCGSQERSELTDSNQNPDLLQQLLLLLLLREVLHAQLVVASNTEELLRAEVKVCDSLFLGIDALTGLVLMVHQSIQPQSGWLFSL